MVAWFVGWLVDWPLLLYALVLGVEFVVNNRRVFRRRKLSTRANRAREVVLCRSWPGKRGENENLVSKLLQLTLSYFN